MDFTSSAVDPNTLGLGALPTAAEATAIRMRKNLKRVQSQLMGQNAHADVIRDTFSAPQPDVQLAALRETRFVQPGTVVRRKGNDPSRVGGTRVASYGGLGADKKPKPMWEFKPLANGKVSFKTNVGAMSAQGKANVASQGGLTKQQAGKGMSSLAFMAAKNVDAELGKAKQAVAAIGLDPNILVKSAKSTDLGKIALPVMGAVVGTVIAPGIGTALGASLGSAASKTFSGQKLGVGDAIGIAASAVGSPGISSAISSNLGSVGSTVASMAAKAATSAAQPGGTSTAGLLNSLMSSFSSNSQSPDTGSGNAGGFLGNLLNGGGVGGMSTAFDSISHLFDDGGFSISNLLSAGGNTLSALGINGTTAGNLAQRAITSALGGAPRTPAQAAQAAVQAAPPAPGSPNAVQARNSNTPLLIGGGAVLLLALFAMSRKR